MKSEKVDSLQNSTKWVQNPDVVLREESKEGVLLFNPETNQVLVLNTTGFFIWNHCNGAHSTKDIHASVLKAFEDVPRDQAKNEIDDFLIQLESKGFIGEREPDSDDLA